MGNRYISVFEIDDGYDYSIYDESYHLLDGGVYDNPNISIQSALKEVVADLKEDPVLRGNVTEDTALVEYDYEALSESAEEVAAKELTQLLKTNNKEEASVSREDEQTESKEESAEKQYQITYTVSECGEFHHLGEYHDGIETAEEAISLFNRIPSERMNAIKSINLQVHEVGTDAGDDIEMALVSGKVIDIDMLRYVEALQTNVAAEKIATLIHHLPEEYTPNAEYPHNIKNALETLQGKDKNKTIEPTTELLTQESLSEIQEQRKAPGKRKTTKIEDFGEKIGNAKKDLWTRRGLTIDDLENFTFAESEKYVKKDNVWKKPNYEEMIANGTPVRVAYFIKLVRDSLPTSPQNISRFSNETEIREAQENYINGINTLKTLILDVKNDSDIKEFYKKFVETGIVLCSNSSYWGVYFENTEQSRPFFNNKVAKVIVQTDRSLLAMDREIEKKQFGKAKENKVPSGYRIREKTNVETGEKSYSVVHGYIILSENIGTYEEALKEAQRISKESRSVRKKGFKPKQLEKVERTGAGENSTDITGEKMMETFHFRGGEFGNWLSENDRQYSLNYGYDAFCDLALALGIEKSDISFGGKLAIAFGSRGSGTALAHYEPFKEVINLTKMKGAGSLAHEWGHALDNLVCKACGKQGFMTEVFLPGNEISECFQELLTAMKWKMPTEEQFEAIKEKQINQAVKRFLHDVNCILPDHVIQTKNVPKRDKLSEEAISYATNNDISDEYIDKNKSLFLPCLAKLDAFSKDCINTYISARNGSLLVNDLRRIRNAHLMTIENVKKIETAFYSDSKKMDDICSKTDNGYWGSDIELFARAFACYIKDKLSEHGIQNDYLCGHADSVVTIDPKTMEFVKAYPTGAEREEINRHMDKLINACIKLDILHPSKDKQLYFKKGIFY